MNNKKPIEPSKQERNKKAIMAYCLFYIISMSILGLLDFIVVVNPFQMNLFSESIWFTRRNIIIATFGWGFGMLIFPILIHLVFSCLFYLIRRSTPKKI